MTQPFAHSSQLPYRPLALPAISAQSNAPPYPSRSHSHSHRASDSHATHSTYTTGSANSTSRSMSTSYWNTVLDTSSQAASASTSSNRQCQTCRRAFSSTRAYDEHVRTCGRQQQQQPHEQQSSDKPYVCTECGTAFKKNSNLVKHMKLVHLGERNFACPEPSCGRLFGQKSNLNSHIKAVHLGEKPFVCPEASCGRKFSQKSGLKAHIKTVHNGERPYVCECGSSFGHRGDVSLDFS